MCQSNEQKIRALESQITQNGALFRKLLSDYELLNSQIRVLEEEKLVLSAQLEKILKSKKWRLLAKFSQFRSFVHGIGKFIKP
jgi:uncharacterized protein YdcH (DUF465 family)